MPNTDNYGFEFETPGTQPGVSVTGGSLGNTPVFAEQADTVIAGIDSRVNSVESDIDSRMPTDTGWQSLSVTPGSGFSLDSAEYRRWGPVVSVDITLLRTGSDITANSSGNVLGDPIIATIGTSAAVPDRLQECYARCFITSGTVGIETGGDMLIRDLHSDSSLRNGDDITITATYFTGSFS